MNFSNGRSSKHNPVTDETHILIVSSNNSQTAISVELLESGLLLS